MDSIYQIGIAVNLFFQNLGGWLSGPMKFFTFLGSENFYMLVMPALFWCIDAGLGFRMGMILILGNQLNGFFKILFHGPRPYWIDTRVKPLVSETSFGVPSGHAQNAAGIWGYLAVNLKKNWAKVVFIVIIGLIGISRLYLGVHFLHDVLLGWLFGGLTLWLFIKFEKRVGAWASLQSAGKLILSIAGLSILMIIIQLLAVFLVSNWTLPESWRAMALIGAPDKLIDPFNVNGVFTITGIFFGMAAGYAWFYKKIGKYSAKGSFVQKAFRYIIGVIGVIIFWYGLDMLFPDSYNWVGFFFRYFRYGLVGLWISLGAPWIFIKTGLAHTEENQ